MPGPRPRRGLVVGRGHRPVRPDARRGAVGRNAAPCCVRPFCGTTFAPATECAELETTFPNSPTGDRQYRHARLHRAQAAVGAPARADGIRPRAQGAAAQGLYPLSADRRDDRGDVGCIRHVVARCRRARLVGRRAVRHRIDARCHAAPGRRQRPGRHAATGTRGALAHGAPACPGGRGRGQCGGCSRPLRDPARRRFRLTWYFRRAVCHHGPFPSVSAGCGARVLSRDARHLAPDGCDPVRRCISGVVGRHHRTFRGGASGGGRDARCPKSRTVPAVSRR